MGPRNLNLRNLPGDPDVQSIWGPCSQMTRRGYDTSRLPSQGKLVSSAAPTLTLMSHPRSLHLTRVITPQITQQLRTRRSWSRSYMGSYTAYTLFSAVLEKPNMLPGNVLAKNRSCLWTGSFTPRPLLRSVSTLGKECLPVSLMTSAQTLLLLCGRWLLLKRIFQLAGI